jgi:hypothetical protein
MAEVFQVEATSADTHLPCWVPRVATSVAVALLLLVHLNHCAGGDICERNDVVHIDAYADNDQRIHI